MAAKFYSAFILALVIMNVLASVTGMAFAQNAGLSSMQLDGKQPISIESDRLEVLEKDNKAIFTGAVNVAQGATRYRPAILLCFMLKKAPAQQQLEQRPLSVWKCQAA